jgi:DNA-binding transcriptional MocR family regulator
MRSAAWQSLSCEARAILVELYALYDASNNGRLFLSVREAASRVGVGKSTAASALAQLIDRGFIRPNVKGAFTLKQRHATSWVLTEFEHAGQLATKDFMRWQPDPKKQNTVRPRGQMVRQEGQTSGA